MTAFTYKSSGKTLSDFMKDDSFVRGIRGPVGSGKSAGCCVEMFRRSSMQEPDDDGIKRTKWAVIRNTNPELRTTTIATWLQWFPENEWGRFRWSPPFTHHIKRGDMDMEVLFLPLDTPEDVKKLLSLELTGVWVNEAREVPKAIIDAATSRVGRYPSRKGGPGATWSGVIMDTNAPSEDHWWSIMSGDAAMPDHISPEQALMFVRPDNWAFYNQPGGMVEEFDEDGILVRYVTNPDAENYKNLPKNYYENMIRGKMRSWIDVYVLNRLGTLADGKPVYQGFSEKTHVAREGLVSVEGATILVGIDFGLTPAAVFAQRLPNGRWLLLAELVCANMGAVRFGKELKNFCETRYPDSDMLFFGDPTGDYRAQTDETTPFEILRNAGILVRPSQTNDPVIRVEAVNSVLARLVDGNPGLLLDAATCGMLKAGFLGGYHYRRLNVSGSERYEEKPNKNEYSHVHDALQYALIGGGEGRNVIRGNRQPKPFMAKADWNPFKRKPKSSRMKEIFGVKWT